MLHRQQSRPVAEPVAEDMSEPYISKALTVNISNVPCDVCQQEIPPLEGVIRRRPFRRLCGRCALRDGVELGDLEARLAAIERGELLDPETGLPLKLYDFQVRDCRRIAAHRCMLCGSQMGTGKTVVMCVGCLRSGLPNLVVVPSSLKRNTAREIAKWRPELSIETIDTRADFYVPQEPGEVVIASYGMLPGAPCAGCRWRGLGSSCAHREQDHPEWFPGHEGKLAYHYLKLRRGAKPAKDQPHCTGCRQAAPLPGRLDAPLVLVGDEVHAFKHPTSLRTKLWRKLSVLAWGSGGYVYGLSGTPYENRPEEGWEVMRSLGIEHGAFGTRRRYRSYFHGWFEAPPRMRQPPSGDDLQQVLVRLRRVRINRRSKDVLKQLPPICKQVIEVPINAAGKRAVDAAAQRMFATRRAWGDVDQGLAENPRERGLHPDEKERRELALADRIEDYFRRKPWNEDDELKAALDAVLNPKNRRPSVTGDPSDPEVMALSAVRKQLSLAKLPAVIEWVETCEAEDEPVVVFDQHVGVVKRLGERPGWEAFHGGVGEKQRDQMVQGFQSGEIRSGLALSIGAGGEGITLTRARVCAFASENWNPAKNRQAWHRIWRIGAEAHTSSEGVGSLGVEGGSILIVRFVADHPVDRAVAQALRQKIALLDALDDPEAD